MSYEVIWLESAQRDVSRLVENESLKWPLTHTIHWLERELARRPSEMGESREDGFRILIRHPFAVSYHVHEIERRVQVISIWHFGSPNEDSLSEDD